MKPRHSKQQYIERYSR